MNKAYALAQDLAAKIRSMPSVSNIFIPQSIDYPGLRLNIDRERASLVGLSAKEIVDNVITALTSNGMVAPSYWIDPNTGNNYMVTVQYANRWINHMSMEDLENIPLRGKRTPGFTPADEAHQAGLVQAALPMGDNMDGVVTLGSVAESTRSIRPPKSITTRSAASSTSMLLRGQRPCRR